MNQRLKPKYEFNLGDGGDIPEFIRKANDLGFCEGDFDADGFDYDPNIKPGIFRSLKDLFAVVGFFVAVVVLLICEFWMVLK